MSSRRCRSAGTAPGGSIRASRNALKTLPCRRACDPGCPSRDSPCLPRARPSDAGSRRSECATVCLMWGVQGHSAVMSSELEIGSMPNRNGLFNRNRSPWSARHASCFIACQAAASWPFRVRSYSPFCFRTLARIAVFSFFFFSSVAFFFSNARFQEPDLKTLHTVSRIQQLNKHAAIFVEMHNPRSEFTRHLQGSITVLKSRDLMESVLQHQAFDLTHYFPRADEYKSAASSQKSPATT